MSDEDDWNMWQTYVAASGAVVGAMVFGKYYSDHKARVKDREDLLESATKTLKGSTVIITGANTGVGYAAAELFAESGAKVVLACRNANKGSIAAAKIRAQSKNPHVTFDQVDLSDFKSIETFAQHIDKVHVLVNNAGEIVGDKVTKYGVESTVLTNYVGHWYLTKLLLPKLAQTSIAENREVRIVNVCSRAERYSDLGPDYEEVQSRAFDYLFKGPEPHQPFLAYSNSKLCNLLFNFELARKLTTSPLSVISLGPGLQGKPFTVTATAVTPGFANTNIFKFANPLMTALTAPLRYVTLKSPTDGGAELVFAAITKDAPHGAYIGERTPAHASKFAQDPQLGAELWKYTDRLVDSILKAGAEKK